MKSILKTFLPAFMFLSMMSCTDKNTVIINTFKDFPEEIQGCACYFSKTKEDLYKGVYVFTDNNDDLGFININGKMQMLDLTGFDQKDDTHWIKVFTNSEYKITVVSEQLWQVDQIWHQKSVITIKDKKGKLVTESIHVFGECGGC